MCGIAGIVGRSREYPAEAAMVRTMCNSIVHRGPDDDGIYASGHVGLGMRRLSIIDLATGHQPIHNEDKTIWIVYNGEVYNFQPLRDELLAKGHTFSTRTDTEVIVHLYEEMGSRCVERLRGMFAFAIYDAKQDSILLARDRLGKKPLHYALDGSKLLFGSEIKTILSVAPHLNEIDRYGMLQYFQFGYIPDPNSAFSAIKKLEPGHVLEYKNDKITTRQYWDLPEFGSSPETSDEEALVQLEALLTEAIRMRLISDVPLGAFLSGGVDSSTVVGLMSRMTSQPVKTFSIGFAEQEFNETEHARLVANRFKTEHHELLVRPELADTITKLTGMLEEPFSDSSMLPTYFVSCLAREHVTVALSGDGGDELFAGYDRYERHLERLQRDIVPAPVGKFYRERLHPALPEGMKGRKYLYNLSFSGEESYIDALSNFPAGGRERSFFSDDFSAFARTQPAADSVFRDFLASAKASDPLSRIQYLDAKTYLVGDILTKVDRMSMAASLEVRVPLLDHEMVEWATRLPLKYKVRDGRRKFLLRKLALKVGVPAEVLDRPKRGFALPLAKWLRQELRPMLLDLLSESTVRQRGYLRPSAVNQVVQDHLSEKRDNSGILWQLLMFECWHRNYLSHVGGKPANEAAVPQFPTESHRTGMKH